MRNPFESFETFIQDHFVQKDQNKEYKKLYLDFKRVTDCLRDWFKANNITEYLNQFPKNPKGMRINYKKSAKEHLEFIDHIQLLIRRCTRECNYEIPGSFNYANEYRFQYREIQRGRSFTDAKKKALKKEKEVQIKQKQERLKEGERLFRPLQSFCNVRDSSFEQLDQSLENKMKKFARNEYEVERMSQNQNNLDIMDKFLIKYIQDNENGHGEKIKFNGMHDDEIYREMIPYLNKLYDSIK
jgi:hypothetical protein